MTAPGPDGDAGSADGLPRRMVAGFLLYGVLCAPWLLFNLDQAYDAAILATAAALVPLLAHFPVGASELTPVSLHNQGYVVVWLVSLFVVAGRMSWKTRITRYSVLLGLVVASQVIAAALQLDIGLALKFQERLGRPLLVGWELKLLTVAFQFFFVFGLQVATFLVLVLTAYWSTGPAFRSRWGLVASAGGRRRRAPGTPRGRFLVAAVVLGVVVAWIAAHRIRERSPDHVAAHVEIGHRFLARGQSSLAEAQYRAAVRGGTRDGEAWSNLIRLLRDTGRQGEALRFTEKARKVVDDPAWRERIRR